MNTLMEEDLDNMWADEPTDRETQAVAQQIAAQPAASTVYPLALADGTLPGATPTTGLRRNLGPLPIWGWVLVAAGVGVGGYYLYQNQDKSPKKNPDDGDDAPESTGGGGDGGWSPSRGRFADMLRRFFSKANVIDKITIYPDADDAKKAKLKHVSPLVTIVAKTTVPMKELEKLARREGLKPTSHEGGIIGFYPIQGKRGRAWEEYIDLLRDDGQTV